MKSEALKPKKERQKEYAKRNRKNRNSTMFNMLAYSLVRNKDTSFTVKVSTRGKTIGSENEFSLNITHINGYDVLSYQPFVNNYKEIFERSGNDKRNIKKSMNNIILQTMKQDLEKYYKFDSEEGKTPGIEPTKSVQFRNIDWEHFRLINNLGDRDYGNELMKCVSEEIKKKNKKEKKAICLDYGMLLRCLNENQNCISDSENMSTSVIDQSENESVLGNENVSTNGSLFINEIEREESRYEIISENDRNGEESIEGFHHTIC